MLGLLGRAQLKVIGAAVAIDDEIGHNIGPGRLDEDVNPLCRPCPALGVTDDPAHGVANGYWTRACELLAVLKCDVGDLAGRGIELIERVAAAGRPDASSGVCLIDALAWIARLRCDRFGGRNRLVLVGGGARGL